MPLVHVPMVVVSIALHMLLVLVHNTCSRYSKRDKINCTCCVFTSVPQHCIDFQNQLLRNVHYVVLGPLTLVLQGHKLRNEFLLSLT